jgi:hypothetical protein
MAPNKFSRIKVKSLADIFWACVKKKADGVDEDFHVSPV